MLTVGIIGCGNMGGSIAEGLLNSGADHKLILCDRSAEKLGVFAGRAGVKIAGAASELAAEADLIVVSVKMKGADEVFKALGIEIAKRKNPPLIVSIISTGSPAEKIRSFLGTESRVVRAMPNVCCSVGAGITAIFSTSGKADAELAAQVFQPLGETVIVDREDELNIATGLSGSGPAFIFAVIESLADGGVKMGLTRDKAEKLAVHTVYGAAKLMIESGKHPGQLKDMVASPGGTTIEGLHALEKGALRATMISAVEAATEKARKG